MQHMFLFTRSLAKLPLLERVNTIFFREVVKKKGGGGKGELKKTLNTESALWNFHRVRVIIKSKPKKTKLKEVRWRLGKKCKPNASSPYSPLTQHLHMLITGPASTPSENVFALTWQKIWVQSASSCMKGLQKCCMRWEWEPPSVKRD